MQSFVIAQARGNVKLMTAQSSMKDTNYDLARPKDSERKKSDKQKREPRLLSPGAPIRGALFQEKWWLDASTGGQYEQVEALSDGKVVARLPFVIMKKYTFTTIRMPSSTYMLAPWVDCGNGKPQTQLTRRLSLVRELIEKLPRFDFFRIAIPANIPDGLAFQTHGFKLFPQYTFCLDCRKSAEELWAGMNDKIRQNIRRAQEKFTATSVSDPEEFVGFYEANLKAHGKMGSFSLNNFSLLAQEARTRGKAEILSAKRPDGRPTAMIFVAWDDDHMYYIHSTRAQDPDDNGSVPLLLWSAIQLAQKQNQTFDFHGVTTAGAARFYANFGGTLDMRLVIQKTSLLYSSLMHIKTLADFRAHKTTMFE